MAEVHSRWQCPGCERVYESPLCGTDQVGHKCKAGMDVKWRRFKRTWRSRYDKIKDV